MTGTAGKEMFWVCSLMWSFEARSHSGLAGSEAFSFGSLVNHLFL